MSAVPDAVARGGSESLNAALAEARDHAGVTIVEVAVEPYSGARQMQLLAQALGAT
ncbi:hypothetical protein [Paraburkholderia sediminicola]|uniref:hypothetical protein n=1 Tax=Paraburkholderia sediminicola TaxID=458836 RepID=UPI0038BC916E